jgi:hypothetical protein
MRRAAAIFAIIIYSSTVCFAWEEPTGLKEYKFGMTEAEVDAIWRGKGSRYGYSIPTSEEEIGGIVVRLNFGYEKTASGERLGKISFVFPRRYSSTYASIKGVFVERYGQPHSRQLANYGNSFGAKFKGEILEWRGARTTIRIDEIASAEYGSVVISTLSWQKQAARETSERIKKAAKDL